MAYAQWKSLETIRLLWCYKFRKTDDLPSSLWDYIMYLLIVDNKVNFDFITPTKFVHVCWNMTSWLGYMVICLWNIYIAQILTWIVKDITNAMDDLIEHHRSAMSQSAVVSEERIVCSCPRQMCHQLSGHHPVTCHIEAGGLNFSPSCKQCVSRRKTLQGIERYLGSQERPRDYASADPERCKRCQNSGAQGLRRHLFTGAHRSHTAWQFLPVAVIACLLSVLAPSSAQTTSTVSFLSKPTVPTSTSPTSTLPTSTRPSRTTKGGGKHNLN